MKTLKYIKKNKTNIIYAILLVLIFLILVKYYRKIMVFLIFLLYDVKTLCGNMWKTDAEYGSYMKEYFSTPIPLEYYKKFNYAVEKRVHTGQNDLNLDEIKQCCDEMLEYIKKNNIPLAKPKQLPIVSMNDQDCREKVLYYVDKNIPFVLRDTDLEVFSNMKFDKIIELFKKEKVLFSPSLPYCKENKVDYFSKIQENKCYVSNVTSVFSKNQDLLTKDDISKISKLSDGHMDSVQLFVGVTKGSGTKMHCAYTNNFFINIEGRKTWTFINPNNTPMVYPYFSESGVYSSSESRFINYSISDLSKFPLLKYCDHYEYTVNPGEILYNPASWWHAVYNDTEKTVALSTRWSFKDYYSKMFDYHLLRSGNLSNPGLRKLVEKIYCEYGILGISLIDEHNILGDEDDGDNIPVWDKITNESHNLCLNDPCHLRWHSD